MEESVKEDLEEDPKSECLQVTTEGGGSLKKNFDYLPGLLEERQKEQQEDTLVELMKTGASYLENRQQS